MNKGLKIIEDLKRGWFINEEMCEEYGINVLENSIKALKIIKEKEVNVQNFINCLDVGWDYEMCEKYCQDNDEWEENPPYRHSMKKEDFDILKEILV